MATLETIYQWKIELLVFDSNIWNDLTVYQQMSGGPFK